MSSMNQTSGQSLAVQDPGRTLGIVGLVLSIFASVVGLIISAVALNQSKQAGFDNGPAKAGVVVGIITTVLSVLWLVFAVLLAAHAGNAMQH